MNPLTDQAALIKVPDVRKNKDHISMVTTYIILPRYLFRNFFSNSSECVSKESMTYQRVLYIDVSCAR
jgi:hypothetical protein